MENQLQISFLEVTQSIDRAYEEFAKAKGMSYISMTILDELYDHPESCTQKQICEETHYPKQTVNLTIKAFWESGYVELREIPTDRRNKTVHLTEKGLQYAKETVGKLEEIDNLATNALSTEQQEQLVTLMQLYEKAFCDGVHKAMQKGDN